MPQRIRPPGPKLLHILDAVLPPGANIVITNDSLTEKTRSQPGFRIMNGTLAQAL